LLVLNSGTRTVLVLSLAGNASAVLECPFEAAHIAPLRARQLYAVSSADGRSAALIRTESLKPEMSYLPAVQ
jgi:hypothetical protein